MNLFPAVFAVAVPLFAATALIDLRRRRIPNELVLGVVLLAAIRLTLSGDLAAALADLKWACIVFAGVALFWRFGWLGGGDAKLLYASALLVGQGSLVQFLLVTIASGGALGLLAFADRRLEESLGWSAGLAFPRADMKIRPASAPVPRQTSVPYGIAISIGCLWALFLSSATIIR